MRRALPWLCLLIAVPARAELPLPPYPNCSETTLDQCPPEIRENEWDLVSWIPQISKATIRPSELAQGSGISLDVAIRYTAGRWDVPIAIIDTGIQWGDGNLGRKVLLNTDELPFPQDAEGQTHATYDLDGNGLVNIDDYRNDARIDITSGSGNGDDKLDPSDLIHTFSDGFDGDNNGYIDDIAGWDFFTWDNDPWPHARDTFSGHGTGVMEDAAREGGDGDGIGVCPNCAILPLRSGDGIITDGDRVGLAIAYAADRGAKVVGMALGALSNGDLTEKAIAYADKKGVVIVSVTGDENSYHHNFPAVNAPILYVHGIRADTGQEAEGGEFTYQSFFGCNNFGPRIDVVAATDSCATGSNAKVSGASGLLVSAGIEAGTPLEPDEVRALFRTTVDDVTFTAADLEVHRTYPATAGWDAYTGYGRTNVGRAVKAVFEGNIPPIARIDAPGWFSWTDTSLVVTGRIAAPRSSVASWSLSIGQGMNPTEWTAVTSGTGELSGELATLDTSAYGTTVLTEPHGETVVQRAERAHEPLLTVKLTVTDAAGLKSEDRRGVWVQDDPDRLEAFPIKPGGSLEPAPKLADIDGDGDYEIIAATGSGFVHVYQADGSEVAGFPVRTNTIPALAGGYSAAPAFSSGAVPSDASEGFISSPAIGDIDGDGSPEIVAASLRGGVYAWHDDGTLVAGFPQYVQGHTVDEFVENKSWDESVGGSPALADVDGDGALDIIVGAMDQRLYLWGGDGALFPNFPVTLCEPGTCEDSGRRIIASPAVGDIDADGDLDVAIGTNEVPSGAAGLLYLVDLNSGTIWPDYPMKRPGLINQGVLPVIGEGHPGSVALVDLDGDGDLEIWSNAMLGQSGPMNADGSEILDLKFARDGFGANSSAVNENSFASLVTNPGIGDLDVDGVPDMVLGGSGVLYLVSLASTKSQDYEHLVGAWSGADGAMFPGYPRVVEDVSFLDAPAVADVDGNPGPEVIYGSGGYFVYAWDADGAIVDGWPKFTGGWMLGGPAVGDIDGDGFVEIVVGTREGYLFAWHTDGPADQTLDWGSMRHDAANTGNYETIVPTQAGPPIVEEPKGCCKKNGETDSALVIIGLLPFFARWRRRQG